MPSINYQSEVSATTLNSSAPSLSPDAFGASVGRAAQQFGNDTTQAASELAGIQAQRNREALAAKVASVDYTGRELALRDKVGPDAKGYEQTVSQDYDNWVSEQSQHIDDDNMRTAFSEKLMEEKKGVLSRSAQWQYTASEENSVSNANAALGSIQNRVAQYPDQYDDLVKKGVDVVNSYQINGPKKAAMVQQLKFDAGQRYFEGKISRAKSGADFDAIAAEIVNKDGKGRDWASSLMPNDYHQLIDTIGSGKKAFTEHAKAQATATMSQLDERNKNTTSLIPPQDLQDMQTQVAATGDATLQVRAARLMRDQALLRDGQRLPPPELRARINAVNGNPGLAYPGIPAELSSAINDASEKTGIGVGYLGGNTMHEYGQYLNKKPLPLNDQFKPQLIHDGLDLRNIRSDVLDAVTLAGQAVGKPLVLTKGVGSAGPSGVDVSTVGMSPQDKAKLAGSLVDAGFTGVSEYDNYMRFDKRDAVPQNYGTQVNGQFWGGWTNLSPDIVKALQDKGFGAGVDSSVIKRALPQQEGIDYSKPTQIEGPDGKPTSSAVGLNQFTEGTWLQMVKTPGFDTMAGIDLKGKTDAQILEMRKDPRVSIYATAAYAAQNKKTLEATLGREVSDAEVHMAHLMGPGGATAFLNAYKNSPNVPAAQLLPAAASANKPVFYQGGDKTQPLTVSEVYNNISQGFQVNPSKIAYGDSEMYKRMLDNTTKELAVDPITHASAVGSHTVVPLSEDGGWEARGNTAKSIAQYYNIASNDMKPFTQDEATYIKNQIDQGSAAKQMQIVGDVQRMGPEMAKAAFKQLEEKDPLFAHAGDLYLSGQPQTAAEILKGRKILQENKSVKDQIGATDADINNWFVSSTGGALSQLPPQQSQNVQDAALAYWVSHDRTTAPNGKMTQSNFADAIQAVSGGSSKNPIVASVNGRTTLLPMGVDAPTMETALHNMTIDDYTKMSVTGAVPRYSDGKVVDPRDIRSEVMMLPIGNGKYKMMLDDGSFLTTGSINADGAEAFVIQPKIEDIRKIAKRVNYVVPAGIKSGAYDIPF